MMEKYCCIYNLLNMYILKSSFKQSLAKIYLQIIIPLTLTFGFKWFSIKGGSSFRCHHQENFDNNWTHFLLPGLGGVLLVSVVLSRGQEHCSTCTGQPPITGNYPVKMSIPPTLRKPELNKANTGTSTNPKLRHLPIQ